MTTRFKNFSLALVATLFAACSNEVQQSGGDKPQPGDGDVTATSRRELLIALQNKLVLAGASSTKGESIATAAENAISTLDVYVFGSETEAGEYSFQERFAYRANPDDKLPEGASELQLTPTSNDGKESSALLKLQKGLFVKLYCIANDTALINPADEQKVAASFYKPLTFTTPGETGTKIGEAGIPTEDIFTSFHTRLLAATVPGDTLVTPLGMAGACTTPIDLTNFDNSARVQASLKLTRLTARFDILNDAAQSRFTIRSVSMGNGRRGSGYFPIRVYGQLPQALAEEKITYPTRAFSGENANTSLCTGAFYGYPCPKEDEGFLILKGLYKVNETEQKEVSYQVPFMQQQGDGSAAWLDVTHNHRYTVAITAADEYHLDADITVADWADDGSVDYIPENKPGELSVKIADGFEDDSEYNEQTNTVSMSLKDGSTFEITTSTNSALKIDKVYAGGPAGQLNDWLKVSEPQLVTRAAASVYKYTVSLVKPYIKARYPRATLRFSTTADASEKLLFVEAISVPQPIVTSQPPKAPNGTSSNPNSFDPELLTASVYRITGSQAQIKITCPDGITVESKPDWLDVTQIGQNGSVFTFDIILNNRDVEASQGIIVFHNNRKNELKTEVNVTLLEAPVVADYSSVGTENAFTPGEPATETSPATPDDVVLTIKDDNRATVKVTSMDRVTVQIDYPEGSPEWLSFTGAFAAPVSRAALSAPDSTAATKAMAAAGTPSRSTMSTTQELVFIPVKSKLAGAQQATVTLHNMIGGKEYVFTVTPKLLPVTLSKGQQASVPLQDALKNNVFTLYQLPGAHKETSQMQVSAFALGGSILTLEGEGATISPDQNTANEANYILKPALAEGTENATVSLHAKNYTDQTKKEDYTINVLRSDLKGGEAATLTAVQDQTVTFKVSSYEGFTIDKDAIRWQPEGESGGTPWFTLPVTTFEAGTEKTVTLKALATAGNAQIRPSTVTVKNNIVNGGDLKVVVSPVYAAPALVVVDGTAQPAQNTLTAGPAASTLKLYRVNGSTIQLKATAIGGSTIQNATGVTVTGGDTYSTENIYTVTLQNGATSGSFEVVNKSDASMVQTVTVDAAATTITRSASSVSLVTNNGQTINNTVSSPEGFVTSINWNGGSAWFTLGNTFNKGNQTVTATMINNLSNVTIKTATVTLTNKIEGGENITYSVAPDFQVPMVAMVSNTANRLEGTTVRMVKNTSNSNLNSTITLRAVATGGTQVSVSGGLSVTTATNSNNLSMDYIIKVAYNAGQSSGTITFSNKSNTGRQTKLNVTITNSGVVYPTTNEPAIELTNYWVSPYVFQANRDGAVCPDGWRLPGGGDIQSMCNSDGKGKVIEVLCPSGNYWLSNWGSGPWYVNASNIDIYINNGGGKGYKRSATDVINVRCIMNK